MQSHVIAILLVTAAVASYANHRLLRLPAAIGLMLIALVISIGIVVAAHFHLVDIEPATNIINSIDFTDVLLHGMLAYLLFAGALHVDFEDLRREAVPVALLATVGVFITTFAAGTMFWGLAKMLGIGLPYVYALLFGALIAPTDPIAVLAIMKQVAAPAGLQMRITGESLFNDGIGVAVFLAILGVAMSGAEVDIGHAALLLFYEAAGGIAVGFVSGWVVYRLLSGVDEYSVEVLLTLALAAGVYSLAEVLQLSAPIAVVVAGLLIGNHGRSHAMSDKTRGYLDTFWELIDEILNALLFVLIGLEVLLLQLDRISAPVALFAVAAVAVVLLARLAGVFTSAILLKSVFGPGGLAVLTWAGLRGGISIALALSLPDTPQRNTILVGTYAVVVFSVIVQGLTLGRVLERYKSRLAA